MSKNKMTKYSLFAHAARSWWVFLYSSKDATSFRSRLVIDILMTLFRVIVLLLLYVNIYKVAPQVGSILSYEAAMWSIGAYFVALAFSARRMYREMSTLVRSGNIELYVTRPFNLLVFMASRILGTNIVMSIVTVTTLLVFLLVTVGMPPNFSVVSIVSAVILLFGGLLIETLLAGIVGLLAIWMENSNPIWMILDKFILILGGSYVPVAFFPKVLQDLARYSPFGATRFVTFTFYPDFFDSVLTLFAVQIFWIVVLLVLVMVIYRKGMKSIFVNGS